MSTSNGTKWWNASAAGPIMLLSAIASVALLSSFLMSRCATAPEPMRPLPLVSSNASATHASDTKPRAAPHRFYTAIQLLACSSTGQCKEYDFCSGHEPRVNGIYTLVDQHVVASGVFGGVMLVCVWERS